MQRDAQDQPPVSDLQSQIEGLRQQIAYPHADTNRWQMALRRIVPRRTLLAAVISVATLALIPTISSAASSRAPAGAANAKSVSLRPPDVLHVLGKGITQVSARYSTLYPALGVCASTPPSADYNIGFVGPQSRKGILGITSDVYTYKSANGPRCKLKSQRLSKAVEAALGEKSTTVHGVGEQAFILDTSSSKSPGPPVYTLGLNFIRGSYRAVIIVQSTKPIRSTDMIRLGAIVDRRMTHP